ncbi:hypothetical protein BT69DRAFT_689480 [Atractiella rhizophila]|nr:hypothetical protein BT69DRAFT_689480 [Atractiella rhizophila]
MRQPTQASQLLRDWDWEVDSIATEASKAPEFSATYPPPHTQDSYENRDRKVTIAQADKSSVPCDTVPVEEQAFSPTPETEEPAGSKPSKTSRNRHGSGSTKKASKGISAALANPFKDCMEETGLKTSVGSAKVQLTLELGPDIVFQVTEGCPKWTRNVIYKAFHKNATRFAWLDVLGDKTYGAFSFNSYNLVPSDMLNYDLPAEGDVVLYKDNYSGFRFGLFFRPGARFYTPRTFRPLF